MTVLATVVSDAGKIRIRPGIVTLPIPCRRRKTVRGLQPAVFLMALGAHLRADIRHPQERAVGIVVRTVAGRTLELTVAVKFQPGIKGTWTGELVILGSKTRRKLEGDGVVISEIRAGQASARRYTCRTPAHDNRIPSTEHVPECDGSIVAAQAEDRVTRRLTRLRNGRTAAVRYIRSLRRATIPHRPTASSRMWRMTEFADLVGRSGPHAPRTGRR